ncbi:Pleckstrin-like protein [Macrophomina phaseolina MS6]|uniref:Pleckstrin-like protein n=1 Tax=Macrophomina phaseolina (strain MS6) TaxID=1126212 RepID=K2S286_MACPH|nr:Pleckstrin-like protein [Macrophomina phaseolina MS6]
MLVSLTEACRRVVAEAEKREELRNIQRRIETINFHHVEGLDLMGAGRRIVHQGSLACKVKGKGLWNQVHCVLLDNFMFWGRIERPRESWFGKYKYGEKLWVLEAVSVFTEPSLFFFFFFNC